MTIAAAIPRGLEKLVDRGWLRNDIRRITELIIRCGEEYNPSYNWRRSEAWYRKWLSETFTDRWHYFHVVRSGRVLVAAAAVARSKLENYDGHIHSVFVDPEFRRRGLGRLITERVLQHARAAGMRSVEMEITINPIARELYRDMGFVVVQADDVMALSF